MDGLRRHARKRVDTCWHIWKVALCIVLIEHYSVDMHTPLRPRVMSIHMQIGTWPLHNGRAAMSTESRAVFCRSLSKHVFHGRTRVEWTMKTYLVTPTGKICTVLRNKSSCASYASMSFCLFTDTGAWPSHTGQEAILTDTLANSFAGCFQKLCTRWTHIVWYPRSYLNITISMACWSMHMNIPGEYFIPRHIHPVYELWSFNSPSMLCA